jgi:hypothetical protein
MLYDAHGMHLVIPATGSTSLCILEAKFAPTRRLLLPPPARAAAAAWDGIGGAGPQASQRRREADAAGDASRWGCEPLGVRAAFAARGLRLPALREPRAKCATAGPDALSRAQGGQTEVKLISL